MEKLNDLQIKPLTHDTFKFKQSEHEYLPKLPIRGIILAPSGSGKTVLLSNIIVNLYKGCFERIYVFSPSIGVDDTLNPIIEYQKKHLETNDDKLYFTEYHEEDLINILDQQKSVIEYQKKTKQRKLHSILIIIDDMADDSKFSRSSKTLHTLFIRGRHFGISVLVSSQKYNALSPIIRVNALSLIVFKLRNYQELDTVMTENSAVLDKKLLLEIYKKATEEKYNFLYIDLAAKNINEMFYYNFTHRFKIN